MRFCFLSLVFVASLAHAQQAPLFELEEDRDSIRDRSDYLLGNGRLDGIFEEAPTYSYPSEPSGLPAMSVASAMISAGAGPPDTALIATLTGKASRIFAGPGMFPPEHFAAYGIIAFKSRPLASDRARFVNICSGYVAALLTPNELDIPMERQLVTVWPVDQDDVAQRIMSLEGHFEGCELAADEYGLAASLSAINDARMALKDEHKAILSSNKGPFLLAWSPSKTKGEGDALIFGMDLSNVETAALAREKFEAWRDDIEAHQERWIGGWKEEGLADVIGSWADKWGEAIVAFIDVFDEENG